MRGPALRVLGFGLKPLLIGFRAVNFRVPRPPSPSPRAPRPAIIRDHDRLKGCCFRFVFELRLEWHQLHGTTELRGLLATNSEREWQGRNCHLSVLSQGCAGTGLSCFDERMVVS